MRVIVRPIFAFVAPFSRRDRFRPPSETESILHEEHPCFYETPAFDKIQDSDYGPAIEEGMKRQVAEIEADRQRSCSGHVREHARGDGALGRAPHARRQGLLQPGAVEHERRVTEGARGGSSESSPPTRIRSFSIRKLYARVKAIYDKRASSGLDPESAYLLERYHEQFIRAGADAPRVRAAEAPRS